MQVLASVLADSRPYQTLSQIGCQFLEFLLSGLDKTCPYLDFIAGIAHMTRVAIEAELLMGVRVLDAQLEPGQFADG